MAESRCLIGKCDAAILGAALVLTGVLGARYLSTSAAEGSTTSPGVDDWVLQSAKDHHGPTTWTSPSRDVVVYITVGSDMGHAADASRADSYRSFGGGRHRGLWFNEAIEERESGLYLNITFPKCGVTPGPEETLWFREPVNASGLLSTDSDVVAPRERIVERRGDLLGRADLYLKGS